jgi:hypothetical protein
VSRSDQPSVRFHFDEDADLRLAEALLRRGFDVSTSVSARILHASDDQQLAFAVSEQRTLVTHNFADFPDLHEAHLRKGAEHSGIIILIRQFDVTINLRRILNFLQVNDTASLRNQLIWLSTEFDSPSET